jgi:CBS domain-containing protein
VVLGASGKFMGLITDYDIRVALTNRHLHEDLTAKEICNVNTFTASEDEDFWTFMLRIQGTNKMHTVVPIVSNQGDLLGIVRTQDVLFRNIDMDKSNVSF